MSDSLSQQLAWEKNSAIVLEAMVFPTGKDSTDNRTNSSKKMHKRSKTKK